MDNALAEQQLKLMQAVANGDRRAFEQLYRLTSPHLFAVALRMLAPSRTRAEETFTTVLSPSGVKADTYNAALSSPMTGLRILFATAALTGCAAGKPALPPARSRIPKRVCLAKTMSKTTGTTTRRQHDSGIVWII